MTSFLSRKVVQDMRQSAAIMDRARLYEIIQWLGESHEILRDDHEFLRDAEEKSRERADDLWDRIQQYTTAHMLLRKTFGHLNERDVVYEDSPVWLAQLICKYFGEQK